MPVYMLAIVMFVGFFVLRAFWRFLYNTVGLNWLVSSSLVLGFAAGLMGALNLPGMIQTLSTSRPGGR